MIGVDVARRFRGCMIAVQATLRASLVIHPERLNGNAGLRLVRTEARTRSSILNSAKGCRASSRFTRQPRAEKASASCACAVMIVAVFSLYALARIGKKFQQDEVGPQSAAYFLGCRRPDPRKRIKTRRCRPRQPSVRRKRYTAVGSRDAGFSHLGPRNVGLGGGSDRCCNRLKTPYANLRSRSAQSPRHLAGPDRPA